MDGSVHDLPPDCALLAAKLGRPLTDNEAASIRRWAKLGTRVDVVEIGGKQTVMPAGHDKRVEKSRRENPTGCKLNGRSMSLADAMRRIGASGPHPTRDRRGRVTGVRWDAPRTHGRSTRGYSRAPRPAPARARGSRRSRSTTRVAKSTSGSDPPDADADSSHLAVRLLIGGRR